MHASTSKIKDMLLVLLGPVNSTRSAHISRKINGSFARATKHCRTGTVASLSAKRVLRIEFLTMTRRL
jgi:hypothetical protein